MRFIKRLVCISLGLATLCQPAVGLENVLYKDGKFQAPLSSFTGSDLPIVLQGSEPRHTVNIPVPFRLDLEDAQLSLNITNSIGLIKNSQLSVWLDERPVAQLPLQADKPESTARMRLPLEQLTPGYHQLSFRGAQHYAEACEDPTRPELWSRIHVDRSQLSFTGDLRPLDPVLAMLPDLIDAKLWDYYQLTIATPSEMDQLTTLTSGSLAAQGAALMLDFAPMGATHKTLTRVDEKAQAEREKETPLSGIDFSALPAGDVFVVGTRTTLAPYLRQDELSEIGNSYFSIHARPDDPRHFVLLIAGSSTDGLISASQAFSMGDMIMPYAERALLTDIELPESIPKVRESVIAANKEEKYRFREFGFESTTLRGMGSPRTQLQFWAQPDPFAPLKDTLELELELSYAPGMGSGSVLNLMLNNRFESGVPLRNEDGGRFSDLRISIPYSHLEPGWNQLSLIADMKPSRQDGKCQPFSDSHLQTTVFDTSRLSLKTRGEVDMLPNLELLQRSGMPLVQSGDGRDMRVVITGANAGTLSATWTFMAKLAQLNRRALVSTEYSLSPSDALLGDGKNILFMGLESALPQQISDNSTFPSLSRSNQNLNIADSPQTKTTLGNALIGLLPKSWREWVGLEQTKRLREIGTQTSISADFRRESAMLLMRNPKDKDQSLVAVISSNSGKLAGDVQALMRYEPWGRISGDTVLWSADSPRKGLVRSARIGQPYDEDSLGAQRGLGLFFTEHPWLFVLLILVGLGLFLAITHFILVRRQQAQEAGYDRE